MGSITGQIQVGHRDPYHGGIYPTHVASLYENDRPGWFLEPTGQTRAVADELLPDGTREPVNYSIDPVVWIPSAPENILEDGLLLIAAHVLWGWDGRQELDDLDVPELIDFYRLELEKMPAKPLAELRRRARAIDRNYKLVVTVLTGSSLLSQLPVLEHYDSEVEVCTVTYSRLRRHIGGTGPLEARGSLEPPPGSGHRYYALNVN